MAWSSAAGHVDGGGDVLIAPAGPLVAEVSDWRGFLQQAEDDETVARLRRHGRTARPLGDPALVDHLEALLGRRLRPQTPGPKPQGRRS